MVSPLTRATSTGDGLKVTTLRGVIGASTAVLGLRPTLPRFEQMLKLPKDRDFTGSPPLQRLAWRFDRHHGFNRAPCFSRSTDRSASPTLPGARLPRLTAAMARPVSAAA